MALPSTVDNGPGRHVTDVLHELLNRERTRNHTGIAPDLKLPDLSALLRCF